MTIKNGDLPEMPYFYEWINGTLYSNNKPVGDGNGWVDENDYLKLRRYTEALLAELERTK